MRTVNTYYTDKDELKVFLHNNEIFDEQTVLVQVFTGIIDQGYIKSLIDDILFFLPDSQIIGTTTDGEILNTKVSTTRTVLSFTCFEHIALKTSHVEYKDENIFEDAYSLAQKIKQDDTKLIITFADGLNTNGEKYLKGLSEELNGVTIAGGLSGDNAVFNKTFVFTGDKVVEKGAAAVSLAGDLEIYTGYNFNWEPIGKELVVTDAQDNIIRTIDNRTAYDTYKYYLGEDVAKMLPAIGIEFPLILKRGGVNMARAVTGVCDDGSLKFAGDIKKGDRVRFGYGNSELILNNSVQIPNELASFKPESTFVYSCMARRRFMDQLIEKELDPLFDINSISGFFTYGEFFTAEKSEAKLLNQTMTVLSLREAKKDKDGVGDKYPVCRQKNEDLHTVSVKALSHLINVTSNELERINENLEKSIKREKKIISQQKKRIEAQAKMAQMGDMISNIAHQWKQPLSTISTAITSIQLQKELGILKDEYFDKSADSIVKNVIYLGDTISVFRDFLKEDKKRKTLSIQSVLKTAVDIAGTTLKDHHIKIFDNIDYENNYMVNLVSGELIQVVINLLNNSKDAIVLNKTRDSFVKIDCRSIDEKKVLITIEDNAGGIPESIIGNVFDLYFTTKKDIDGTGLGLHMCKEIIQKHMGGEIYVNNTSRGCIFSIEIPREHP